MSKHTKGPWHFAAHARENEFEKTEVPFDYKGSGFCGNPSIYGADGEDVVGCDEYYVFSNEADVRLICSAPDLLEVCKSQHDAIYWLSTRLMAFDKSFIPPESSIWSVLQAGYAAIAKATGVNDE